MLLKGIGGRLHPHEGTSDHDWHMVIDLEKCIGCNYCVWGCQAVNDVADDSMRWNVGFPERTPTARNFT
jgi:Fe-S-cluster-containing dehydrogenase component